MPRGCYVAVLSYLSVKHYSLFSRRLTCPGHLLLVQTFRRRSVLGTVETAAHVPASTENLPVAQMATTVTTRQFVVSYLTRGQSIFFDFNLIRTSIATLAVSIIHKPWRKKLAYEQAEDISSRLLRSEQSLFIKQS